ncbi:MAG: hypothetical protein NVS4B10_22300 [Myxococcales bacterium]
MSDRGIRTAQAVVLAALVAWAGSARAEDYASDLYTSDPNWSATAARTVGRGSNVLQAEAGWPGIGFTYLRGIDDRTDFGIRANFLYGFESTTTTLAGAQLQAPYRRMLTTGDTTNVAFHVDPGLTVYSRNGAALVGVGGPIGVVAGWQVSPRTTLDAGADFPILLSFTNPAGLLFGPQLGGGAEYAIDRNLHVTIKLRVGPEFALASGQAASQFAFTSLVGLAYNAR